MQLVHITRVTLLTSKVVNFAVDVFWFAFIISGLISDLNIPRSLMDGDENAMTFGQIVPILLLSSTIFVFREAIEGSSCSCLFYCAMMLIKRKDQRTELEKRSTSREGSFKDGLLHDHMTPSLPESTVSMEMPQMSGARRDIENQHDFVPQPLSNVDTEMG